MRYWGLGLQLIFMGEAQFTHPSLCGLNLSCLAAPPSAVKTQKSVLGTSGSAFTKILHINNIANAFGGGKA